MAKYTRFINDRQREMMKTLIPRHARRLKEVDLQQTTEKFWKASFGRCAPGLGGSILWRRPPEAFQQSSGSELNAKIRLPN